MWVLEDAKKETGFSLKSGAETRMEALGIVRRPNLNLSGRRSPPVLAVAASPTAAPWTPVNSGLCPAVHLPGLADHQARVAPSKPNLAWIQPSLGTSPIWSGSDPSHAWPSPSEGATHAKPDLTAQSLGSAKPDLGQCQGPTPARPAKSSPLGAGAGPGGARTRGTGACAQTRLQHHICSGIG
ncbi:hypothetical protein PGT21_010950 [Puccinia graminis f. sp. tritici]|uniref:Uncharacterized protein n=1 Tax=Puccinia graminis f. sp. tritici TaxID=56615 RepID=A0A5B0LS81_PUCGR|nr:hypothetical protein PGTUg99_022331 [Puccinia graminis f. sp. tritici]KAA1083903.1 hypothetical protein PGT21_010950 [Puccinia graminis f. sp. tritici]